MNGSIILGLMLLVLTVPVGVGAIGLEPSITDSKTDPQIQPKAEKRITQQDKRGTKESPLIIEGDITTKTAEKSEADRKQGQEKIEIQRSLAKYAGVNASVTALLVLVTSILAWFTFRLWKANRQLVEGAQDTAEVQLRAYLGIEKGDIWIKDSNALNSAITVKNSGQTPAYKARVWCKLGIFEPDEEQIFPSNGQETIYGFIGSGGIFNLNVSANILEPHKIAGIRSGQWPVFAWGNVTYWDVFQRERMTAFRITLGRLARNDTWTISPCPEGNEST